MFPIPENWKSRRQVIVETYIRTQSVPDTSELIYGKRDSSFVRTVVIQWRKFARDKDISSHATDEQKDDQGQSIA